MNLDETRAMLTIVAHYDHRTVTDDLVRHWQVALLRHPIEAVHDAIDDHFERCGEALRVTLNPTEVLVHIQRARELRERDEARQRQAERNESVFGSLTDHRRDWERLAATEAARVGRAELDQILQQRRKKQPAEATAGSVPVTPKGPQ